MIDLSFVIPCYNEEGNVRVIYDAIHAVFDPEGIRTEIVMVNDGSKDNTRKALKELYNEHKDEALKVISFSRNFGKEAAILCGMRHTTGAHVCFIDADMQQRPEVALEMYRKLTEDEDLDCVAAYQAERKEGKLLTFFKNCFYRLINKMCDIDFVQGASDFRILKRPMVDAILSLPEYYRFSKGIFSWVGFNTFFMPYEVQERNAGSSSWNFRKLFKYAIEGIVGYTTTPLQISTVLGVIVSALAVIYMVILIIKTLVMGIDVPGYATTLSFVLLIGGIQLLMLGIIGEYLAKAYIQGKNRPVYIEKEVLEGSLKDGEFDGK